MRRKKYWFKGTLLALLTLSLLTIGLWVFKPLSVKQHTQMPSDLISHQIASIEELATSQYHYTNMGTYEDFSTWADIKLPFTTKKFVVSYEGDVTASINMNEVTTRVKDKTIEITLPKAHILSHQIDEKSLNVFDEASAVFNRLSIEDVYRFMDQQKEKIEQEAVEKGLLEDATERAKQLIEDVLFDQQGLKQYTIVFNQ